MSLSDRIQSITSQPLTDDNRQEAFSCFNEILDFVIFILVAMVMDSVDLVSSLVLHLVPVQAFSLNSIEHL